MRRKRAQLAGLCAGSASLSGGSAGCDGWLLQVGRVGSVSGQCWQALRHAMRQDRGRVREEATAAARVQLGSYVYASRHELALPVLP